jgi:rod shape-determining protein MreC
VYGQAQSAMLELRFMPANVDIQEGDTLVTSGLDGVYMPGLPVGKVTRIEREAGYAFAKIQCQPAAGVTRYSHVLVLSQERKNLPPLPQAVDEGKDKRGKRKFEERDNLEAAKDASAKAASPADSKAVSGSSGAGGGNVVSNVPSNAPSAAPSATNSNTPPAKAAQ